MKKWIFLKLSFLLILCSVVCNAFAFENLFYTLRYGTSSTTPGLQSVLKTINNQASVIDIIASQAYIIRADGVVTNNFNPWLLGITKKNQIKFMALASNGSSEGATHQFLRDKRATARAIQSLLQACTMNGLYGIQIDFENVAASDRKLLTQFYQDLAKTLHQHKFALSIAITPRIMDGNGSSAFQAARYANWTGAFDYKALGDSSDFVTLMAYDQHEGATTPGPIASFPWSEAVIKYALKYIPAQKISLGIPTYSGFWKTARHGHSISTSGQQIEYDTMNHLLNAAHQTLHWDNNEKIYYCFYEKDELNEFIFAEEARSFGAKYALAKQYNLRGISVWRLGIEDPKIWDVVK